MLAGGRCIRDLGRIMYAATCTFLRLISSGLCATRARDGRPLFLSVAMPISRIIDILDDLPMQTLYAIPWAFDPRRCCGLQAPRDRSSWKLTHSGPSVVWDSLLQASALMISYDRCLIVFYASIEHWRTPQNRARLPPHIILVFHSLLCRLLNGLSLNLQYVR